MAGSGVRNDDPAGGMPRSARDSRRRSRQPAAAALRATSRPPIFSRWPFGRPPSLPSGHLEIQAASWRAGWPACEPGDQPASQVATVMLPIELSAAGGGWFVMIKSHVGIASSRQQQVTQRACTTVARVLTQGECSVVTRPAHLKERRGAVTREPILCWSDGQHLQCFSTCKRGPVQQSSFAWQAIHAGSAWRYAIAAGSDDQS